MARVHTYVQAIAKVSYNVHVKGVYNPIPEHSLNLQGRAETEQKYPQTSKLYSKTFHLDVKPKLGGFQKNQYFLGYKDFVDIFGRHHKI